MSLAIAIPLLMIVLVVGTILWPKVRPDNVGRKNRVRRQRTGLQGQVGEWLYWDAPVAKPDLARYAEGASADNPENPADRALHALVVRLALEQRLGMADAYQRLKSRGTDPVVRAFLNGKTGQAVRIHWQRRYRGPEALFYPWFYAIATVRYGRRHLFLETMSALLKEMSNQ
jgi:hypothetical protein